jgi:hypothetical protein
MNIDKAESYFSTVLGWFAGAFLFSGLFILAGAIEQLSKSGWDNAVGFILIGISLFIGYSSLSVIAHGKTVEVKEYEQKTAKARKQAQAILKEEQDVTKTKGTNVNTKA